MTSITNRENHIHFLGVGGIGMSALALILVKRGYSVSGSDKKANNALRDLASNGIKIFESQNANNISKICENKALKDPIIVISSAIPKNNEELQAAYKANLRILHRSDVLSSLINNQPSIVVAGSHGKTTTSTLITTLFGLCQKDPTAVIGGVVPYFNSNGHAGKGKYLIAEADESDGTLIKFKSDIGIITNLELDHTDHYKDLYALIETMRIFGKNSKKLLINYDCKNIKKYFKSNAIRWSTKEVENVNFSAIPISMNGRETTANFYENGKLINTIKIPLPGNHNLSNTIAAISACRIAEIPFKEINKNLIHLKSPLRRFDFQGIWEERQIVDDYAHHPSEIDASISMARLIINKKDSILPNIAKRLVVVFQPHRYSRTKDLINSFSKSLAKSDLLFLAPIYSAGEKPIKGINIDFLKCYILKECPNLPIFTSNNIEDLAKLIKKNTLKDDLILIMGAGDINVLSKKLKYEKEDRIKNLAI